MLYNFSQQIGFNIICKLSLLDTVRINCQSLVSEKKQQHVISLSPAVFAQSVVKVQFSHNKQLQ